MARMTEGPQMAQMTQMFSSTNDTESPLDKLGVP